METEVRTPVRISLADIETAPLVPGTTVEGLNTTEDIDRFFAVYLQGQYGTDPIIPHPLGGIPDDLRKQVEAGKMSGSELPSRILRQDRLLPQVELVDIEAYITRPRSIIETGGVDTASVRNIMLRGQAAVTANGETRPIGKVNREFTFFRTVRDGKAYMVTRGKSESGIAKRAAQALGIQESPKRKSDAPGPGKSAKRARKLIGERIKQTSSAGLPTLGKRR